MGMVKEFKEFAMKGNVVDMAVGLVIGAAFGKIVTSLVGDIIMPPIGMLIGHLDFSQLVVTMHQSTGDKDPAVVIRYGAFLNNVIDFIIVAFAIFLVIKQMNHFRRKDAPAPTTKNCPECAMSIPIAAKRCGHCTTALA